MFLKVVSAPIIEVELQIGTNIMSVVASTYKTRYAPRRQRSVWYNKELAAKSYAIVMVKK